MARSPSFCGVILAAGESSRMGSEKALLPWPPAALEGARSPERGTFLTAQVNLLQRYSELVLVVAGGNAERLAPLLYSTGGFLVRNPAPQRGQFSSLQVGLQEVLNRGRDAALVALVDRPPALPETVATLREAFLQGLESGAWAAIPELGGRHGHPIIFGREMISAILAAPATATARSVEHAHAARLLYVPVNDPFIALNINTPEDYAQLCAAT